MNKIDFLFYLCPALLVVFISIFYFKKFIENEEQRRSYLIMKDLKKDTLSLRLQAYERMVIFLDRIQTERLLERIVTYQNQELESYCNMLINTINREFEHNISQQIYVTKKSWEAVFATKKAVIDLIIYFKNDQKIQTIEDIKAVLLDDNIIKKSPVLPAIDYLKEEVRKIL